MGLRAVVDRRLTRTTALVTAAAAAPEPTPRPVQYPDPITRAIAEAQASVWLGAVAESIPAVRRAVRLICGTVGAWQLTAWRDGRQLDPGQAPAWLPQPDPERTSQQILSATLHDGIWHDRSVWRQIPGGWRRVSPSRIIDTPAEDPDDPPRIVIDGETPRDPVAVFRWGGAGGLRSLSVPLVALMGDVFAAAARYARSPAPEIILKNTGVDIDDDDIDALISRWEGARARSTTGYLGAYLDAITAGYSAKDLQLIEAMDELTKEVARLFGLPPAALGVSAGDSLTYSTTAEQRRDVLEALKPWRAGVEQTLSMNEYAVDIRPAGVTAVRRGAFVPYGTEVRLDATEYARESWPVRMAALGTAVRDGLITRGEARALEPTITAVALPGDDAQTPAVAGPASTPGPAAAGPPDDPAARESE